MKRRIAKRIETEYKHRQLNDARNYLEENGTKIPKIFNRISKYFIVDGFMTYEDRTIENIKREVVHHDYVSAAKDSLSLPPCNLVNSLLDDFKHGSPKQVLKDVDCIEDSMKRDRNED